MLASPTRRRSPGVARQTADAKGSQMLPTEASGILVGPAVSTPGSCHLRAGTGHRNPFSGAVLPR